MGSSRSNEEVKPDDWERVGAIIRRTDLSAVDKCLAIGLLREAVDGIANATTMDLMVFASVTDRETVFRAIKRLRERNVVHKESRRGQTGKYNMYVEQINIYAEQAKSGRQKPDGLETEKPKEPDGFIPTTAEPVGFIPTTSKEKVSPVPPLKETTPLQASKQQDAARELAGLNGSTEPMIADVMVWMTGGGDRQLATNWLTTFLRQYPQEAIRQAYFDLKTDLANGRLVANKLRVWGLKAAAFKSHAANGADKQKPSPFANFGKRYTEPLKR